jgi:hypothetical protein
MFCSINPITAFADHGEIKMAVNRTVEKDLGAKKILQHIKQMKNASGTIGIHEGAGNYPNGEEIVAVAFWNEFGTVNAPERSFIRSTVDENRAKIQGQIKADIGKVLDLRKTPKQVLSSVGFQVQELIRGKIETLRTPPNAPATIANKPEIGDNPLVESRLLKRSINFEVDI